MPTNGIREATIYDHNTISF